MLHKFTRYVVNKQTKCCEGRRELLQDSSVRLVQICIPLIFKCCICGSKLYQTRMTFVPKSHAKCCKRFLCVFSDLKNVASILCFCCHCLWFLLQMNLQQKYWCLTFFCFKLMFPVFYDDAYNVSNCNKLVWVLLPYQTPYGLMLGVG